MLGDPYNIYKEWKEITIAHFSCVRGKKSSHTENIILYDAAEYSLTDLKSQTGLSKFIFRMPEFGTFLCDDVVIWVGVAVKKHAAAAGGNGNFFP